MDHPSVSGSGTDRATALRLSELCSGAGMILNVLRSELAGAGTRRQYKSESDGIAKPGIKPGTNLKIRCI